MVSSKSSCLLALVLCAVGTAIAGDTVPHIRFVEFIQLEPYDGAAPPPPGATGSHRTPGYVHASPPRPNSRSWLRAHFRLERAPTEVAGLYVSSVIRGVKVFVNGVEVGNTSLADAEWFGWNYPIFFTVPPTLLHAGDNVLDLRLTLNDLGYGSLSGVQLGSHVALNPLYSHVLFWRVTGPQIVSLISVLLGLLAIFLWLRRRGDSLFGWFGLACLAGAFRNTHFFVNAPIPTRVYELWAAIPLHVMAVAFFVFSFRLCGRRYPRVEAGLIIAALAWILVAIAGSSPLTIDLGYYWLTLVSLGTIAFAAVQCWQQPRVERLLLLLALLVSQVFGALDLLMLIGARSSDTRIYLMPYSTLFFSLAMGAVLIDAFAKARTQQERLNEVLDQRLALRERELADEHEKVLRLENERVAAGERRRILRDIHDGLGSQLISSIQLVEAGALSNADFAAVLRDCVDDLRLAIDSLKPAGDDLLLVLANFRYRMEPRLTLAGLRLDWRVDADARSPALTSEQVLHVLRIVQESFTNAVKHAHPRCLAVAYLNSPDASWSLSVSDDGAGFDLAAHRPGDGLRNMRVRAAKAGVTLSVHSTSNGTSVQIEGQS